MNPLPFSLWTACIEPKSFSSWLPIVPIPLNFYHTLDFHRGATPKFPLMSGIRGLAGFPGNLTVSHFAI